MENYIRWDHCPKCGFLNKLNRTGGIYGNGKMEDIYTGDCWLCKKHIFIITANKFFVFIPKVMGKWDDIVDSVRYAFEALKNFKRAIHHNIPTIYDCETDCGSWQYSGDDPLEDIKEMHKMMKEEKRRG